MRRSAAALATELHPELSAVQLEERVSEKPGVRVDVVAGPGSGDAREDVGALAGGAAQLVDDGRRVGRVAVAGADGGKLDVEQRRLAESAHGSPLPRPMMRCYRGLSDVPQTLPVSRLPTGTTDRWCRISRARDVGEEG